MPFFNPSSGGSVDGTAINPSSIGATTSVTEIHTDTIKSTSGAGAYDGRVDFILGVDDNAVTKPISLVYKGGVWGRLAVDGVDCMTLWNGSVGFAQFGLAATVGSGLDVFFERDAANTLAQRNGTSAQESRLYGTYTSSTVYERLSSKYDSGSGAFVIGTEKGASGGSARPLVIQNSSNMAVAFAVRNLAGADIFGVNTTDRFVQMGGEAFGVSTSTGKTYIYNSGQLVWNSTATASDTGSADVGIARSAAGELKVTDSSSGFGAISSLYQRFGAGSPESVVTAPVGAVYHRTDGGAGTSFYVKESGTGNTGWVAK